MADYYPLIARAVTGLDKSTGEARRALYERARTALVTQLRGVEPALSEADITRERLALEEAIRKVEAEAARRPRQEAPESPLAMPPLPRFERPSFTPPQPPQPPQPPPPPPPPEVRVPEPLPPPPEWEELRRELDGLAPPPEASDREPDVSEPPPPAPNPDEPPLPFDMESRPELAAEPEPPEAAPPEPPPSGKRLSGQRTSLVDEGLKGFRDVMAETDDLGEATASASKSVRETREAFASLPPSSEVERIEPRIEPRFGPEDLMPSEQDFPPPRPEPRAGARARLAPQRPIPEEFEESEGPLRRGLGGGARKIITLAVILVLAGAGFFAYRQWGGSITGMFQSARVPATQASKEPQARPKISDRIGGATQDSSARPPSGTEAAVAQRAVLYELPANPQERPHQYVGSVIWRTEAGSSGQPADVAAKAEVEIPERHIRMSLVIRRNTDPSLPASHTVEVLFSTPADFPSGGIANLGGVLMENNPQGRGEPLNGVGVKVTNGFFLVGLSSGENFVRRNLQLLKERAWMDLQLVYNNGQRALLLIEKGVPGDRVIEDTLNAWGQMPPSAQPR